ncbi:DUF885 domain-containing protein [Undibacterium sp. Rencai35W]|uniref:DUF885 domain-containing protein n=1 Tax=Undibacterium sp. Rencai35W TaxID=3413046 RepID=UPI003BF0B835
MARFFKWTGRALLVLLLILAVGFIHVWYFKPLKADWFYARVMARFALDQPEMLSGMRVLPDWLDFYSDKLNDASSAAEQKLADDVKANLQTLRRYDRASFDRDGQLSFDTLEYYLRIQDEGDRYRYLDFPVNQLFGIQSSLPNFMNDVHQVTSVSEAKNYIARLNHFEKTFDQVLEGLKLRESKNAIPPQFTVEKVLEQMQGFVGKPAKDNPLYLGLKEKLGKVPAGQIDAATRTNLLAQAETAIQTKVYPAYGKLIQYFIALKPKAQGNFGAWHLPDGDAYYAWTIRKHTTTDMTPQQVHELGLAEVANVSAQMDAILKSKGLIEGSVGARILKLAADPEQQYPNTAEGKQAMLKGYQTILDEVNKGLGNAFDIRPKLGVEVKAVPKFAEATAPGAYYDPGAFDGTRPGLFFANMRDTTETPKFGMRTLAYHEGIPGHHFQQSIAQEMEDVPFFRRIIPFTAYVEGWALYAERLAWEMGFEKDAMDNLGRLQAEMMRSVRLVVDTGIHYKHWTREQAIDYMTENTGMAIKDVTAEIERYMVDPGQALAYKVGMLKILALREKAKLALGDKFDLKQFHNEVLTHGALPLVVLERVIDDWIAKRKKA